MYKTIVQEGVCNGCGQVFSGIHVGGHIKVVGGPNGTQIIKNELPPGGAVCGSCEGAIALTPGTERTIEWEA